VSQKCVPSEHISVVVLTERLMGARRSRYLSLAGCNSLLPVSLAAAAAAAAAARFALWLLIVALSGYRSLCGFRLLPILAFSWCFTGKYRGAGATTYCDSGKRAFRADFTPFGVSTAVCGSVRFAAHSGACWI
jgi:hypothetical protein